MQKKIIALAVAGLVSGAAFAQSNVTVFGIMDVGYKYSWGTNGKNYEDYKAKSEIKAGGQDGSRFGFRGTEDLGNGLKANFEMAAGFDADTGSSYGGRLMSEGAFVGLSGDKWGAVKAGYFGSFIDDATGVDVTGRIGLASSGLISTGKYANFVAYYSPVFNGFQAKAGYSSSAIGQDKPMAPNLATPDLLNIRTYTIAADYKNAGLDLRAAYAWYDPAEVNYTGSNVKPQSDSGNEWLVGAGYDFKVVSVSALYQSQKNVKVGEKWGLTDFNGQNDLNSPSTTFAGAIDTRNFWALGVKVPMGAKDSIALGYGQSKIKYYGGWNIDDDKAHKFGITYLHTMSKRTNIYALYGNVSSDEVGNTGIKAVTMDGYKNAFNVGIRHLF